MDAKYQIRCHDKELAEWRKKARKGKLSEWIRAQCNKAVMTLPATVQLHPEAKPINLNIPATPSKREVVPNKYPKISGKSIGHEQRYKP